MRISDWSSDVCSSDLGSLYGKMIVRDFSLADPKGRFLTSPELRIDWRPFAFLSNHVDVRSATAQRINVLRLPEFKPVPDTGEPLLPDIDLDVARLQVDRIVFDPETGRPPCRERGRAYV